MMEKKIKDIVSQISSLEDRISEIVNPPAIYRTNADPPISWDMQIIEKTLSIVLPPDLIQLWEYASRIRLYEDITYGQWGTILWSPLEVIDSQVIKDTRFFNEDDFHQGDLLIGEFIGDSDLAILVRCDPNESDFGKIMVPCSLERREEWPTIAETILIFLEKMLAATGIMYWEYGFKFQKKQIDKWWSGEMQNRWEDEEV